MLNKTITRFAITCAILGIISLLIDILELLPYNPDFWFFHLIVSNGYPVYLSLALFTSIPFLITSDYIPKNLKKYFILSVSIIISIYFIVILFIGNTLPYSLEQSHKFYNVIKFSKYIWIPVFNIFIIGLWIIGLRYLFQAYQAVKEEEMAFFDSITKK